MPSLKHRKQWSDASQDRKISVTAVDLKGSVCKDHQNCVIARAIKREMNAEWVDVGANTVIVKPWSSKKYLRYRLNSKAKEQVRFFDKEGNFAPCYVVLSAPSPSHLLGMAAFYKENRTDKRSRKGGPRGERNRLSKPSR